MLLTRIARARCRLRVVVGLSAIVLFGSVMAVAAQGDGGGDMIYACIDSRNGALYGVQVDSENVRCSRGDTQVSWSLGEPEPGPPGAPGEPGEPGAPGSPGGPGLTFVGSWQSGTVYMPGIVVEHRGSSYVSVQAQPQPIEPPNEAYWQLIAARGEPGADGQPGERGQDGDPGETGPRGATGQQGPFGLGFNWSGEFDSATQYSPNDVVYYEGSAWIAIAEQSGSTPGQSGDWDLLARGFEEEDDDNGSDDGNGGSVPDPNGGGDGLALQRVEETQNLTPVPPGGASLLVPCPSTAPRIVSGGYHLVDSSGDRLTTDGPFILSLRGNAPEFDSEGVDGWRVSWVQLQNPRPTDGMVVHAICTAE